MNDKQMAALIMAQLKPLMLAHPDTAAVGLAKNYQPRQQGGSKNPYAYFFKPGVDRRYGHPQRKDVWDLDAETFVHTEVQVYESLWQFSAWVPQDPKDVDGLTESDILNVVSSIMQSDTIIAAFKAAGVGILRVTDVRNPYIVSDKDQFSAVPSFDISLTHERILSTTLPAVVTYDLNVSRV